MLKLKNQVQYTLENAVNIHSPAFQAVGGEVGAGYVFYLHGEVTFLKIIKMPRGLIQKEDALCYFVNISTGSVSLGQLVE